MGNSIDREKIISAIEKAKKQSEEYAQDRIIVPFKEADMIIALLKEQGPIKPTVSVDTWICSKCGHMLESQELIDDKENPQVLIHELYEYCPHCGRAVKWDAAD